MSIDEIEVQYNVIEEVICEELTPWIITSAISKVKVKTSENPRIYLIKLWRRIKK